MKFIELTADVFWIFFKLSPSSSTLKHRVSYKKGSKKEPPTRKSGWRCRSTIMSHPTLGRGATDSKKFLSSWHDGAPSPISHPKFWLRRHSFVHAQPGQHLPALATSPKTNIIDTLVNFSPYTRNRDGSTRFLPEELTNRPETFVSTKKKTKSAQPPTPWDGPALFGAILRIVVRAMIEAHTTFFSEGFSIWEA